MPKIPPHVFRENSTIETQPHIPEAICSMAIFQYSSAPGTLPSHWKNWFFLQPTVVSLCPYLPLSFQKDCILGKTLDSLWTSKSSKTFSFLPPRDLASNEVRRGASAFCARATANLLLGRGSRAWTKPWTKRTNSGKNVNKSNKSRKKPGIES